MKVTTVNGKTVVDSPYHPGFVGEAHRLNGKWDGNKGTWAFDARDEERVRAAMVKVYGTDGSGPVPVVDVRVTVTRSSQNPYFAYGRLIASRYGRDDRVKLGEGVVIDEGGFSRSAGSRNHPSLTDGNPVVLLVRDVPVTLIPKEDD